MKVCGVVGGIMVVLLCLASGAWARVWYVHPDSSIKTIQAGLDSCRDHDTVRVGPGTYLEHINWPIRRGIDLISQSGPATTIVDGDSNGIVITIANTLVDTLTVISGLTIRNGYAVQGCGIYLNNASPTISNNVISDNKSDDQVGLGAGVFCGRCAPKITNNTFRNNRVTGANGGGGAIALSACTRAANIVGNTMTANYGTYGGGICILNSTAGNIFGNNISFNISGVGGGGGVYLQNATGIRIERNTLRGNRAPGTVGGALYIASSSTASLLRNTIDCDSGFNGGGLHVCNNSSATIDSCIITNCGGDAIYTHAAGMPVIHYSSIINNGGFAIVNQNSDTLSINAENNWWGDSTGAYHPTLNPGGRGDTVSDYVDFIPWLRFPVVKVAEQVCAQRRICLVQISPNPFREKTAISLSGAVTPDARLEIFDAAGRRVRSLDISSHVRRPSPLVSWNGHNDRGRKLPAGVYLLRFTAGEHQETGKVVMVE